MMKYTKVYIDTIAYELPSIVVTSGELEEKLLPLYEKLHFSPGQLEELTGIYERRWWDRGFSVSKGAVTAAKKALEISNVNSKDIDILIYAGVCREGIEPATACGVAAALDISCNATIFDLSNACLGVINGIVEIANRIELGQCRAGLVVSAESAREINETTIENMLKNPTMENFIGSVAILTGGGGAVAVIITDGSFSGNRCRRVTGGVACTAPEFYNLNYWRMEPKGDGNFIDKMYIDSVSTLKNGIGLGLKTWNRFLEHMNWNEDQVQKTICHQVGTSNRDLILKTLKIPREKDFFTYPYLGNMGTVSLPITAAIAEEREFLQNGDNVCFLGIGSGLNCLMLGIKW